MEETKYNNQDTFTLSLPLISILSSAKNDKEAIALIGKEGLPMEFSSEDSLLLYLYLHQMLIPFHSYFHQINDTTGKVLMNLLNEKYYLLSNNHCNILNIQAIAHSIILKPLSNKDSKDSPLSLIISLQGEHQSSKGQFELNKTMLELGKNSRGRLDIYIKAHIAKSIILYSGFDQFNVYTKIYAKMEDDLTKIYRTGTSEPFTQQEYAECINLFTDGEKRDDWLSRTAFYIKMLSIYQNIDDTESIANLERLFVQLLGHYNKEVRNEAVIALNIIYDETTFQDRKAFNLAQTKVKLLKDNWTLELIVRKQDFIEQGTILVISSPSINPSIKNNVFSWIKCQNETVVNDNKHIKLVYHLGSLAKCGYYDWSLIKFNEGQFSSCKIIDQESNDNKSTEGKGRVIVFDHSIKDLSVHEVHCDLIQAEIDKQQGKIIKRGNFSSLEAKLDEYSQRYVNCLYIMGALERDNEIAYDEHTGTAVDIQNPDASPMAVTCRSKISNLLGGESAFESLMTKAKKLSIKVILDSLTRISSSRCHRKYKDILLHYLDSKGKMQICYGTDGHSVHYDDSALLNYRKVETWNMLIIEIISLVLKYNIDGIHLDNCQSWPQILETDVIEMYRIDPDGEYAYKPIDILNGEIVMPNIESGYYNSDLYESYANPFLVKLTKEIWKEFPSFVFFGECWLNDKFTNRHCQLAKSGIIPRLYSLPIIISEILGKKVQRNGSIENVQPKSVTTIRDWYVNNYQELPEGALLVQSSCGQVWPYPALLYGRGNWSAVDLLFGLPDIPMTFMDEIDGEAYRVQIVNVYEAQTPFQDCIKKSASQIKLSKRSKSFCRLIESKIEEIKKQSENQNSGNSATNKEERTIQEYIPKYNLTKDISELITLSGMKIHEAMHIKAKQDKIAKEIGPEFGFDLHLIKHHYDHRRRMRYSHECLRRGRLIYLNAIDCSNQPHPGVFAFARRTKDETGVFAINFTNSETNFSLDMNSLLTNDDLCSNFNAICYIEDWINEVRGDFFFLREMIGGYVRRTIKPYSTICFGFQIFPLTHENYKKTMEKSNSRMINDIKSNNSSTLDCYQITLQLKEILDKGLTIEEFAHWLNFIIDILFKYGVSFNDYIKRINFIKYEEKYSTKFFNYCFQLKEIKQFIRSTHALKIRNEAEKIIQMNSLGPICFVTPELGRWSTVGGLGVMVDELTQGLAALGQDVIVISPYYNQNRKKETGYLSRDPIKFEYIRNIEVKLDQTYSFGIHYGVGNGGIRYYFIHNAMIFPNPYPEGSVSDNLRTICLMGKSTLQFLCDFGIVPALIVTNDWFTGLCAAYSKNGCFGTTFQGTTFFHICHNLESTYEGRLYPSKEENTLDHIHQLPSDWLVDFQWKQKVINPSRCAIKLSDQWGTVSNSYKRDLMDSSPLAPLLNNHYQPFGFPNGIFKVNRLKALQEKAGTNRDEAKKILQTRYFGYGDADLNVPIYSFVGRITQQKGVLLILEAVEQLVQRTSGKINILVGGMGNPKDPYCAACINKINYLRGKYPYAFWANPFEFFTDGPLVNLGSDFGLMPSLFEPGGIVQHEFFIAGTPVIAFRTGGLKDTVFEFEWDTNKGNGITFDYHNYHDFYNAVERSLNLFHNKDKLDHCRKNAFNSAIDVAEVSRAWCGEFCRLRDKVFFNAKDVYESKNEPIQSKVIEALEHLDDEYIFNQKEMEDAIELQNEMFKVDAKELIGAMSVIIDGEIHIPVTFNYPNMESKKYMSVQICGSFDKWQVRHPLSFNPIKMQWTVTLKISKGKHSYKYIVDGDWVVNPNERTCTDNDGMINNCVDP